MKFRLLPAAGLLAVLVLPVFATATDTSPPLTTREQTIRPIAVPAGTAPVQPKEVALYGPYAAWAAAPGEDQGRKLDLMPAGYTGAANAARLASFFSMSDVHITDKESPAEVPYFGWNAPFRVSGLYSQAYSPVILSTTQVLDGAVKTINALHQRTPFDFGLVLGDVANSSQFNELRWFIDVLDGKSINPSSGEHVGADSIDYQKPFQAAGLDPSIPWYEVIGNHDQFWMGVNFPSDKLRSAMTGSAVLNIGPSLFAANVTELTGVYVGVVDGTTPYGDVIKGGPMSLYATPPTVTADPARRPLATADSFSRDFIAEFFDTTSSPAGHGFDQPIRTDTTAACYTFEPVANLPLKVIVLDDTCKTINPAGGPGFYGSGWIDPARYAWLTHELQQGQDAGQLMIVACHIPINPQKDLFDSASAPQFYPTSYKTDAALIATLHQYSNLIMLMAGHRHINVVTPQPSPDPAHPEYGFWEVETPSLRDFPRQFRTFDIRRNTDNTISIVTTDVDPVIENGSPAAASRGYAIGAYRIFGNTTLDDSTSHAFNAELVKPLSLAMQAKIAGQGSPLDLHVANFSTLGRIDESHPLTAGFVITDHARQLLIRAVGPSLGSSFGVTGCAPDPQLTLNRRSGVTGVIGGNDNWNADDATIMSQVGAFPLAADSKDAAMIVTLSPGVYTVTVSAADHQPGQALVELYDVDPTIPGSLVNFSARSWVSAGGSLSLGTVALGSGTMLVRAVGPGLAASFGLTNTLADPRLQLWPTKATAAAASNDNWNSADADTMAAVGAFPLAADSKDAALLFPVVGKGTAPRIFTLQADAPVGQQGDCLLEAYLVK